MNDIKVVVAEDEYFTRQGVCRILEEAAGLEIIGQAENGEQALAEVRSKKPDVLLLDISMPPGINGIEVIKQLRAEQNEVLVIALTDEKRVVKLVEKAGGNGYIPKDKYQMLVPTVQCVASTGSKIFINPEASQAYANILARVEAGGLIDLEIDVWRLIAYKNEEIARRLHKTEGRIRNLVTDLYFKLDIPKSEKVSQRIQAIELARVYGILEDPEEEELHPSY